MASPAPPKPLDERILLFVSEAQDSIDSGDIARQLGLDAQALEFVGTIKSLIAHDMITAEVSYGGGGRAGGGLAPHEEAHGGATIQVPA